MSGPGEDGFLGRWSKRKLAEPEPKADIAPDQTPDPEEALAGKSDDEILEELGLPDPDQLADGDDFKKFMASAVPQRLRNRALRKLWLTNPVLANLDELVDYGEDYTDAATVVENLQTAYQVGKGWLKDKVEAEDEPDEDTPAAEELAAENEVPESLPQPEADPAPGDAIALQSENDPEMPDPPLAEDEPAPVPRRMRFRFENS